jgi:hypothetical protein
MPRWIVEEKPDTFDDVGADSLEVKGGCLVFKDVVGKITVAYAVGTWRTVTEAAE